MPELPDVEVFRRYLTRTALKRKIEKVEVRDAQILKGVSARALGKKVKGQSLDSTARRGKYLLVPTDSDGCVIFHFGMTGFFRYFDSGGAKADKYDRALFHLDNGKALAFNCSRKLGFISHASDAASYIAKKKLGRDAIDYDLRAFRVLLENGKGALKPLLMNQQQIAGIGNVYSDEILFQASLDPKTSASSLDSKQQKFLFQQMQKVLKTAIDGKAQPENFPRTYLTRHREKGQRCPKCGASIRKAKVSGRSCYFCPGHQK